MFRIVATAALYLLAIPSLVHPSAGNGSVRPLAFRAGGVESRFLRGIVEVAPSPGGASSFPNDWHWRYSLSAVGRDGLLELVSPANPEMMGGVGNSVWYVRDPIVEFYELREEGVEQYFIIPRPPRGTGPLAIEGSVTTNLVAREGSEGITFEAGGRPAFQCTNLVTRDATGRQLRSRMQWSAGILRIIIEEEGTYPLLVDPLWRDAPPTINANAWEFGQWDGEATLALAPVHGALVKYDSLGKIIVWGKDDTGEVDFQVLDLNPDAAPPPTTFNYPGLYGENHHPFCAGHAFFKDPVDGREKLLMVGGPFWQPLSLQPPPLCPDNAPRSLPNTSVASYYDPQTNLLTTVDIPASLDTGFVRWYPTCLTLPDGRVLVMGGQRWEDLDGDNCRDLADPDEILEHHKWLHFTPAGLPSNAWSLANTFNTYNYPAAFVVDGHNSPSFSWPQGIFWDGPDFNPVGTAFSKLFKMDYTGESSQQRDPSYRNGRSSVLFTAPGDVRQNSKVLILGGTSSSAFNALRYRSAQIFDLRYHNSNTTNPWSFTDDMDYRRESSTAVLLPDGKVFVVGGKDWNAADQTLDSILVSEMYDPATLLFSPKASMKRQRTYHSIALLLPDGRVFAAGTDEKWNEIPRLRETNYEVYYPPYLFTQSGGSSAMAARPVITSAPTSVAYRDSFKVRVSSSSALSKVVFVRPGSVTHSWNMTQRVVSLNFTTSGCCTLCVVAPQNGNEAPPGNYLLFVLNASGVPSVAKFVELRQQLATATSCNQPSGGCPYLYAWNGSEFVIDNNLLPDSEYLEDPPGYFTDYYKLMQPFEESPEGYRLKVGEFEQDRSFLDAVRLERIDHHPDVKVAVAPDGRLVKYQREFYPVSAIDNYGVDHKESLSLRDGVKLRFHEGDEMVLTFGDSVSHLVSYLAEHHQPMDLLLVVDEKQTCELPCVGGGGSIIIQVPDPAGGSGAWRDIAVSHPRSYWEDYVVDLAGEITPPVDTLRIRLLWTQTHSIDMAAFLVPSPLPAARHVLPLLAAVNSERGAVRDELVHPDSVLADLLPGETINLLFGPGSDPHPDSEQEFVFTTKGYYTGADGPMGARGLLPVPRAGRADTRDLGGPNPFPVGSSTRIAFSLGTAGRASMQVFDVAGRRVRSLFDEILPAGPHGVSWDGRGDTGRTVAPGTFFAVLQSGTGSETRKLLVIP